MQPFPPGQYGVIYADPPWLYEMHSEKGEEKGAQGQYAGMSFDQLAALRDQVLWATAPHAVLFMWTTWAALEGGPDFMKQSMDLMRLWGFNRKTGGHWSKLTSTGKQAFGTGYIFRTADEPFILGTIGSPVIKNKSTRNMLYTGDVPEDLSQLGINIHALRREHSRKPDEMADLLTDLFDGPYLELFARTKRPGWEVWGNETDKFSSTASHEDQDRP